MRCLRPNDEQELALAMTSSFLWLDVCLHCAQKPLVFDDPSMLRQCRYSGLLEAVQSCDDNFVQSKSIRGDKAQAIKQPFCPCVGRPRMLILRIIIFTRLDSQQCLATGRTQTARRVKRHDRPLAFEDKASPIAVHL